ncbi:MAG: YbaK/EbsC family protein [Anaerolineae bacterium]|jgi:Cys-tRNA(Pro)/Cys-tRNA(Cys) deacylase|nr:YbaK/EbsC family protein [Anaerolineae bacterium]MBT7782156.1 YbaK/EbsC family protein [Anaerolineae bacterium]
MKNIPPVSLALKAQNAPHKVFIHEKPVNSMAEAAEVRGQEISQLVRSILFRVGKDDFMLVLIAGPSQLSWKALRAHLGQSRMTMATKPEVKSITGYPIGTVAPIALAHPLRILADENVFIHDEISFGSGQHGAAIIMKMKEFKKALGKVEIGKFSK